jgi:Tol biopolymer transport system component
MNRPFRNQPLTILFLALIALSLGVSTACKKKQELPPPPPPTPTPVLPPGSLVFVQRGHLARLDLDNSQVTPLTGGTSTEWFPACSPDGSQVLYWSNAEGGVYNLWKINLDGSNRTQLTYDDTNTLKTSDQNLLVNDAASWSADGKRIYYAINGNIWVMDWDGFNPETVLNGHSALCPVPSPDGKSVVFITNADDTVYNLWSVTLSDKTVNKLTSYTDWNVGSPSFSKDGRRILFNLYKSDMTQVYTVDAADGSNPINLTQNNRSLCPRFAQNDKKIVFCSYGTGEDVGLEVYLMNANGTEIGKSLTPDGGSSPSWAPARVLSVLPAPTPSPARVPASK